jgi:hypothetical protein
MGGLNAVYRGYGWVISVAHVDIGGGKALLITTQT